jgi:hypothetical protein
MNPECLIEVQEAIGRPLVAKEAEEIVGGLYEHMRELARAKPDEWRTMTGEQKLRAAADAAAKAALERAEKTAQRKAQNIVVQARESSRLDKRAAQLKARGSKQPFHDALFERLVQVENYAHGLHNEYLSQLMDTLSAMDGRFFGLFDDPAQVRGLAKAMLDGDTSDPNMVKAAKTLTDVMESLRVRQNNAGADIGKLDYSYLPQPWDVGRIARTSSDEFVADMLSAVPRDRYVRSDGQPMDDVEMADLIRSAQTTIATEGRNKLVPGQQGRGSRASRFDDAHRAIHFGGADAYLKYTETYGRGSMLEAISGHVAMATKNIAMMEEFGANTNATFKLLKDTAEKFEEPGRRAGWTAPATLDMTWDTLNGTTGQPVSARMAQWGQTIRSITVATKLQGTLLSSVTDVPLQVLVAKTSGVPFGKAMTSVFDGFGGKKRRVAHELALGVDEVAGEMARWHDGNLGASWASKLATTTMKVGLMEAWTNGIRRGFSLTYSGTLERMRAKDWDSLHEGDRRQLEETGVTPDDWRVWQLAEPTMVGDVPLLTKDGIRSIPVEKLDALLGGELGRVRAQANAQVEKLDARNKQETEWLDKRRAGYAQAQKDAAAAIEKMRASKDAELADAADIVDIQAQLLQSRLDLAAVAYASGDISARGFGRREGKTEKRVQELETRLREATTKAGQAVAKRAEREGAKLAAMRKELEEFTARATERMAARDAVMAKIKRGVDPALDRVRDAAIDRATARLLGHIDALAKTAVLAPDLLTRATLQQGTKAGTPGGESLRMLMLFKSFPLAIVHKHMRRIKNIPTTRGKVAYSAAILTGLTLFGALALQLKDMASGKDPRDMTTGKFWQAAFMQGGGVGIFGDVLYTGMGGNARGGQANWTSMAGPVFGTGMDLADVTLGNAARAAQGKDVDMGADALRFARGNTPFINLWYTRAAIDHLVLHDLQEAANPGYLRRMKQRARKDWDQGYWWEPGETMPDRAPSIEAAAGGN